MSKLDGYKEGDRFAVTIHGTVRSDPDSDGDMRVIYDGISSSEYIFSDVAAEPTFQITRIEPAFKVGDEVRPTEGGRHMEVVAILKDGRVVVEYEAGEATGVMARDPSCFTHA